VGKYEPLGNHREIVKGLRAVNLVKSYNKRKVVNQISLDVNRGEIVGLLGPNGAGKTTTFYMVVGLTRPESGQVLLDGEDITSFPMHLRAGKGVSYLPQEPSIFRKLTVEENIIAVLETLNISSYERKKRARALLRELNILHIKNAMAYTLSGGERRRVEISRALATSPVFILLDEPFAGIDPIAVSDIQSIIEHLKNRGIGVLITDHSVRETLSITDRAYIISEGEIIASGSPEQVAKDEKVRQTYLGNHFEL
jgi:lipopolysaccharide export system ATP-binding protein